MTIGFKEGPSKDQDRGKRGRWGPESKGHRSQRQ